MKIFLIILITYICTINCYAQFDVVECSIQLRLAAKKASKVHFSKFLELSACLKEEEKNKLSEKNKWGENIFEYFKQRLRYVPDTIILQQLYRTLILYENDAELSEMLDELFSNYCTKYVNKVFLLMGNSVSLDFKKRLLDSAYFMPENENVINKHIKNFPELKELRSHSTEFKD